VPIFATTKILLQLLCTTILAVLAWYAWQTPAPEKNQSPPLRITLASHPSQPPVNTVQLWRVITRRVITKTAFIALNRRLTKMHLKPIKIQHIEKITMHAFDDAKLFSSRREANIAARFWQKKHIQTNIIKAREKVYLLSLGRFYQPVYATETQQKLIKTGRKFRYQKRTVPIPTWRFTFAPDNKSNTEELWRRLNTTGIIMPVIMSEARFQAHYHKP